MVTGEKTLVLRISKVRLFHYQYLTGVCTGTLGPSKSKYFLSDSNIMKSSDPTTTDFCVSADNEYSAKYYCRKFGRQRQNQQIEKSNFKPKMTSQHQN
jgi:hypothetical protein